MQWVRREIGRSEKQIRTLLSKVSGSLDLGEEAWSQVIVSFSVFIFKIDLIMVEGQIKTFISTYEESQGKTVMTAEWRFWRQEKMGSNI